MNKPASVQSIHFPKCELSLRLPDLAHAEQCLPDGLLCGEFDAPGDLCVAVGSIDGTVHVFKASVGSRVWTQISGLGTIGALLPLRAAAGATGPLGVAGARDLLVAVTAGERVVTVLDLFGGAIWKARIEPVVEACAWASSGSTLLALASAAGTVALYSLEVEAGVARCVQLHSWRLDDEGGGAADCLSFASDGSLIAALTSGAVFRLRADAPAECVRRGAGAGAGAGAYLQQGGPLPGSRTRAMGELLVTVSTDARLRLADEKDAALLDFSLAEDAFVFGFATSRVLRLGNEDTVTACSSTGDTWFVDAHGNVLLFAPFGGQASKRRKKKRDGCIGVF